MSETGPGKLNLSERLKARSAEDLREVEIVIRAEHERLAERLRQSSDDALDKIRQSISAPITEIEREIVSSRNRMRSALTEIEMRPLQTMRRTAILSAVIAALIATLPWAVMTYLGMSLIDETRALLTTKRVLEAEIAAMEESRAGQGGAWIQELDTGTFLVVPTAEKKLFTCGTPPIPCVRLME